MFSLRRYKRLGDEPLRAALLNIDKVGWKTTKERERVCVFVCAHTGLVNAYYHPGNYNHFSAEVVMGRGERKLKVISGESRL